MKKYIFLAYALIIGSVAFAQTEYDALRMGQTDIVGSARYMSMGGAFGALGGDASALKDNPAGLGVYRSGEVTATLNGMFQSANADWEGATSSSSSGFNVKFNNFPYVMSVPFWEERTTGLLHSNFSFSYNRVKNFNRVMRSNGGSESSFTDFLAGFTNGFTEQDLKYVENSYDPYLERDIPWLSVLAYDGYLINNDPGTTNWFSALAAPNEVADARNIVNESGGISEYSFGWGGNFNNNLFLGANINIADLTYSLNSILTEDFNAGGYDLQNILNQSGLGVNLKLGAIYLPTNNVRLGLAFHTPTFYTISEVGYAELTYENLNESVNGSTNVPSEGSRQNFNLMTPMQAQLSAAYMFGRKGVISFEYNFVNYTGMRFSESEGGRDAFERENEGMKEVLRNGHVIKVGGEYKPIESVALRAGYAMLTGATHPTYTEGKTLLENGVNTNTEYFEQKGTNFISFGVGYRQPFWYVDLSYALKMQNEDFYPYQFNRTELTASHIKSNTNNIALTVGFKM